MPRLIMLIVAAALIVGAAEAAAASRARLRLKGERREAARYSAPRRTAAPEWSVPVRPWRPPARWRPATPRLPDGW